MDKQKLESLLIDYIDGKLNSVDKHYVEQELLKNPQSFKVYEELKEVIQLMSRRQTFEPTVKLKKDFEEMLNEEIKLSKKGKIVSLNPVWYRVAAAVALLIVGVGGGLLISKYNQHQEKLAQMRVEKQEVQQMITMITNDESAGQRILGLRAALRKIKADDDILDVLINTLNTDPNTNVRMAALEGLVKFYEEPSVRKALISSLQQQTDPVIQIALIQILVQMKEKSAIKPLEKILGNDEAIPAVKDEAQMGTLVLS